MIPRYSEDLVESAYVQLKFCLDHFRAQNFAPAPADKTSGQKNIPAGPLDSPEKLYDFPEHASSRRGGNNRKLELTGGEKIRANGNRSRFHLQLHPIR